MNYAELKLAPTPNEWLEAARSNIDLLLIDHANCEKRPLHRLEFDVSICGRRGPFASAFCVGQRGIETL